MTDDFTHKLLFEQWEEDEYSHEEYMMTPRWCEDENCIFPDPYHSPDECYTAEMAEEYMKEGMRTSEEYKLALSEVLEKVESDRIKIKDGPDPIYSDQEMGILAYMNTFEEWLTKQIDAT